MASPLRGDGRVMSVEGGCPLGGCVVMGKPSGGGAIECPESGCSFGPELLLHPAAGTVSAFYANGCKRDRPVGLSLGRRLSSMRATQWVAPTFGVRDIASGCPLGIRTRIKHERYISTLLQPGKQNVAFNVGTPRGAAKPSFEHSKESMCAGSFRYT